MGNNEVDILQSQLSPDGGMQELLADDLPPGDILGRKDVIQA